MSPIDFNDPGGAGAPLVVNAGCGPKHGNAMPAMFDGWRCLRVDVDPDVAPDVVADITDLSSIPDGVADAVWSAHCLEHLYAHEAPAALAEFHRILGDDGFLCVIVPDLQAVARHIAEDRLHQVLYASAAGPVTAHDVVFGYGPALEEGRAAMAHRCGFTPSMIVRSFRSIAFDEIVVRRREALLELAVVARKRRSARSQDRDALMAALAL